MNFSRKYVYFLNFYVLKINFKYVHVRHKHEYDDENLYKLSAIRLTPWGTAVIA